MHLDDGPDIVRINISRVSRNDSGLWKCIVSVSDSNVYRIDDGEVLMTDSSNDLIGSENLNIHLIVLCELKI